MIGKVPLTMMVLSSFLLAVGIIYYQYAERSNAVLLTSALSMFLIFYSAHIYEGHFELVAGLNAMTEEQKSVYNLIAITHSTGTALFFAVFTSFFGMVIGCYFYGHIVGACAYAVIMTSILLASAMDLRREKYLKNDSDHP